MTEMTPNSEKCIATVGLALVDHVYVLESFPTGPEKYFAVSSSDVIGGIAANAAKAVAMLGAEAKLVGRVGDDSAGKNISAELVASGVDVDCLKVRDGHSSPSSAVLVDAAGERVIVNHKSRELFSDPPEIDFSKLQSVSAILGDLRWISGTLSVFKWAKERDIPTILDFDLCPDEVPQEILENTSHIIFGESALKKHVGTNDLTHAIMLIKQRCPSSDIAVTAGSQGVLFLDEDGTTQHIPSKPVEVVNTLGAGDVFHGAAALAIAEGQTFEGALQFANNVAALRVSNIKPNHFPSREEVMNFERITK
ncbi:PfkB family carbohydrate kinase [Litoreibacter sp.]|nr:PfkB family carbohydrate kinase [Litoreibacter sp.]